MSERANAVVVNIKDSEYDFYCGRGSIFGNPYILGRDGSREQVIERYKEWFEFLLRSKFVKTQLFLMQGKRLGCHCKQKGREVACHVDIIADYINNL